MIVTHVVAHRAEIVPPRKRKSVAAWSERETSFRVAETTAEHAPVVLHLRVGTPGSEQGIRVHGERFWEPFNERDDPAAALAHAIWAIQETGCPRLGISRQSMLRLGGFGSRRSGAILDGTAKTSSYASTVERIQRRVDETLLLVDGVAHRQVRSPLVSLDDLGRAFVGGGRSIVETMSGRSFSVWFEDPHAVAAAFDEIRKRKVKSRSEADRLLAALDATIVVPDAIAVFRHAMAERTDFVPTVEAATWRWRNDRPRTPWGIDTRRGAAQSDIRERILGWEAVRASLDGSTDLDAVRKAISGQFYQWVPGDGIPSDRVEPAETTTMRIEEDFRIPFHRKFAEMRGHRPSDMPKQVEVPRIAHGDAERVCMLAGPDVEVWTSGGRFFAVDPDVRALLRDGTDELPISAPVAELSALRNIIAFSSPGESVENHARHSLADIDGRLGHGCMEPVVVVRPDDEKPSVSLDWRWHEGREKTMRLPFVFGLSDLDGASRLLEACGLDPEKLMPATRVVSADAPLLGRSALLWNIKVATIAILEGLDARTEMLSPEAFAAAGRLADMMEGWRSWRRWRGAADDAELEELSSILAAEIADPFFADVVHPAVLDVAETSLERLRGMVPSPEPEAVEEGVLFAL